MRCEYAHDDGAYVLGALSPSERAAYERHMSDCAACREAVAEIAVLPGLLGRLDPVAAQQLLGQTDTPAEPDEESASRGEARVISLVQAAAKVRRRERIGRRLRYAGTGLVAACLALVVALGIGALRGNGTPSGPSVAESPSLHPMVEAVPGTRAPVEAAVALVPHKWGTEIKMRCSYRETGGADAWTFKMFAYGPDHTKEQLSSWVAGPGDSLDLPMQTRFMTGQLIRLEITRADETPLLVYQVT
jgi:hypothetical protein